MACIPFLNLIIKCTGISCRILSFKKTGSLHSACLIASLSLLPLFLFSCGFDVSIPPGAVINCIDSSECPEGYRCRPAIGRCISIDDYEESRPAVPDGPYVEPATANQGTRVETGFSVTHSLFRDPLVYMETGYERLSFLIDEDKSDRDDNFYVFYYIVDGTETEDTLSVRTDLVDIWGNESNDIRIGALTFDFTAPDIVPGTTTLRLIPGHDNILPEVSAITVNTTVHIGFSVTEPLGAEPVVSTSEGNIVFDKITRAGTSYLYAFSLQADDIEQGLKTVTAKLTDKVGNTADRILELPEPGMLIDTEAPSPPDVDSPGKIVFTRIPWGSDATEGRTVMKLEGKAESVEGKGTLIVYSSAEQPRTELGRSMTLDDGSFEPFELIRHDRPAVYVAAVDKAGNKSDIVPVRDIEWIATMGAKRIGSFFENPHQLKLRNIQGNSIVDYRGYEAFLSSETRMINDISVSVKGSGRWYRPLAIDPSPYSDHAIAYDALRGRIVMFDGFRIGYSDEGLRTTWEWNGSSWTNMFPRGGISPGARQGTAMTYDAGRGRVVLYGGFDFGGMNRETWEWDGNAWYRVSGINRSAPDALMDHVMTYDEKRRRTVLFGGQGLIKRFRDVWEWDGRVWEKIEPEDGISPENQRSQSMVYDASRERTVLFGGSQFCNSTWEWDGEKWTLFEGDESSPPPLSDHAMIYDPHRECIVLMGGVTDDNSYNMDIWERHGISWIRVETAEEPPFQFSGHSMAYDAANRQILIAGGLQGDNEGTLSWNGSSWEHYTWSMESPPESHNSSMSSDKDRKKIVMFGGRSYMEDMSSYLSNETWEWDGKTWSLRIPDSGISPEARKNHAMAYDEIRRKTVLFGGKTDNLNNETWEWDGDSWQLMEPSGDIPAARQNYAMTYDTKRERIVIFGGTGSSGILDDLWEWDGITWTRRETEGTAPPPLQHHAIAYDSSRERLVLFGGKTINGEESETTWEWDGFSWEIIEPQDGINPGKWSGHQMVYDPAMKQIVIFGGMLSDGWINELWTWNGSSWSSAAFTGEESPPATTYHVMAYDYSNNSVMILGGFIMQSHESSLWAWEGGANRFPSVLYRMDTRYAAIPEGSEYISFTVNAVADGKGFLDNNIVYGTSLGLWSAGYADIVANSDPEGERFNLSFSSYDDSYIRSLLHADWIQTFIVPQGYNGGGNPATVSLDYIEGRIHFRRPPTEQ